MHSPSMHPGGHPLLQFNLQLIDQALDLAAAWAAMGPHGEAAEVGAHLRHVIEHWDALLWPARPGLADYDARPRDAALQTQPALAAARLMLLRRALCEALRSWDASRLAQPLRVQGLCGTAGQWSFATPSSLGRELAFVASHAVHHFALLRDLLLRHGIGLDASFGKAPATVARDRQLAGTRALPPSFRALPATGTGVLPMQRT